MARSGVIEMVDGLIEEWRDIPSLGNMYQASSLGRIRRKPTILSASSGVGYLVAAVEHPEYQKCGECGNKGRVRTRIYIHRLVAEAFHGPAPEAQPNVNHKDYIRSNNRPENLEWSSQSENLTHGWKRRKGVA
jgi:hypothetical protein